MINKPIYDNDLLDLRFSSWQKIVLSAVLKSNFQSGLAALIL